VLPVDNIEKILFSGPETDVSENINLKPYGVYKKKCPVKK